ncbi:MAG TPA: flagellar basal body rod C-terminal domain-containing protein [Alphaproteobacteria bacterium]|nr:flagellar basal body rod C-terminal domain-containing protein [Alphaproteobacteria bacterium]
MVGAINTALSGVLAAGRSVENGAQNIANARTVGRPGAAPGSEGAVFQPQAVRNQPLAGGGVGSGRVAVDPASFPEFQPDSTLADAKGFVDAPNVDMARESVDFRQAANAYRANLAVLKVADSLEREAINTVA